MNRRHVLSIIPAIALMFGSGSRMNLGTEPTYYAPKWKRGSKGVSMGMHAHKMAKRRHAMNKIARRSRRINRSGK